MLSLLLEVEFKTRKRKGADEVTVIKDDRHWINRAASVDLLICRRFINCIYQMKIWSVYLVPTPEMQNKLQFPAFMSLLLECVWVSGHRSNSPASFGILIRHFPDMSEIINHRMSQVTMKHNQQMNQYILFVKVDPDMGILKVYGFSVFAFPAFLPKKWLILLLYFTCFQPCARTLNVWHCVQI